MKGLTPKVETESDRKLKRFNAEMSYRSNQGKMVTEMTPTGETIIPVSNSKKYMVIVFLRRTQPMKNNNKNLIL